MIVMMVAAAALAAAAPDAETLGRTLATQGTLGTLLPLQAAKEADELVAAHPELTPAEAAKLRAIAAATADAASERLFAAVGHRYATTLTLADLRALTAFNASPAAVRYRAAQPAAIVAGMTALAGYDFKKTTLTAFCAATGKACPR